MANKQEIWEIHPELFHYTKWKGVEGILTSQKLWATHHKFLNDSSELQLMIDEFGKRLLPFVQERIVKVFRQASFKEKNKMREVGGPIAIARKESFQLARTYYTTAFEDTSSGQALTVPYITSFCAHTSDHPYEQENGLLSQWRGYGEDGYAIVFDTKKLCDQFQVEWDYYYYSATVPLSEVIYQSDEKEFINKFDEEFAGTIEKVKNDWRNYHKTHKWRIERNFADVLWMFTRLKHRGFYEEREVRAVSFPMTKEIEDQHMHVNPAYVSPNKPLKKIFEREKDGAPYIEVLNSDDNTPLPIKRIIVGPQKNQNQSKQKIERLIGNNQIKVHCSETPLIMSGN